MDEDDLDESPPTAKEWLAAIAVTAVILGIVLYDSVDLEEVPGVSAILCDARVQVEIQNQFGAKVLLTPDMGLYMWANDTTGAPIDAAFDIFKRAQPDAEWEHVWTLQAQDGSEIHYMPGLTSSTQVRVKATDNAGTLCKGDSNILVADAAGSPAPAAPAEPSPEAPAQEAAPEAPASDEPPAESPCGEPGMRVQIRNPHGGEELLGPDAEIRVNATGPDGEPTHVRLELFVRPDAQSPWEPRWQTHSATGQETFFVHGVTNTTSALVRALDTTGNLCPGDSNIMTGR